MNTSINLTNTNLHRGIELAAATVRQFGMQSRLLSDHEFVEACNQVIMAFEDMKSGVQNKINMEENP